MNNNLMSCFILQDICRGDAIDDASRCGNCPKKLQEGRSEQGVQALVVKRKVPTLLDNSEPDKVLCSTCSEEALPHLQGTLQSAKKGLKRKRE